MPHRFSKESLPRKPVEGRKSLFHDRSVLTIIVIVSLVIIGYLIYVFLVRVPVCNDKNCFNLALRQCSKAIFVNEYASTSSTWNYEIIGTKEGTCIVRVKALQVGTDLETSNLLRDKTMDCEIPMDLSGSFMPETRIEYCHGLLKESIQDIMIKKMQLYIVQNVGQIKASTATGSVV